MTRRQEQGLRPTGGDWFGQCGGWRAVQTRQALAVSAAFGKIVICAGSSDGATCLVVERDAAVQLVIDVQMALAQCYKARDMRRGNLCASAHRSRQIGRASCRARVCQYV